MFASKKFPIQALLQQDYLKIEKLRKDYHFLSAVPHKHDHYELIWIIEGEGEHYINFKPYPFVKNRVYLLQEGQVHLIPEFDRDGWLILISEGMARHFFSLYPEEEGVGLFDPFGETPYLNLEKELLLAFKTSFLLLQQELSRPAPDKDIIFHLLSALFLRLNRTHILHAGKEQPLVRDKQLLLMLRRLLNKHYTEEHSVSFYIEKIGMNGKSVHQICRKLTGKSIHNLIEDKLIAEAKMLLLTTGSSMKEIAFQLGFNDAAYFGRFFKRHTQMSPAAYRSQHT